MEIEQLPERTTEQRNNSNLACPHCGGSEEANGFYIDGGDPNFFICNACNGSFLRTQAIICQVGNT